MWKKTYLMKPVTVDEAISSNFKHRKAIQIPRQNQRYSHFYTAAKK